MFCVVPIHYIIVHDYLLKVADVKNLDNNIQTQPKIIYLVQSPAVFEFCA